MNKSWIITEKYVGWGTANVIAETKEEADESMKMVII